MNRPMGSQLTAQMIQNARACWNRLFLAALMFHLLALALLIPLTGILFRLFVSLSGRAFVADADIARFLFSPIGVLCMVVVGAVAIAVTALQQMTLMAISASATQGQRLGTTGAMGLAVLNAWKVLQVTARMVALALAISVPFLLVGFAVYRALLSEFDINYYLEQKPSEFWWAAALIGGMLLILAAVLLRLVVGWLFAFPIIIFEDAPASKILRVSSQRASGHRVQLAAWIVAWIAVTWLASCVILGIVRLIGGPLIIATSESLTWLTMVVGLVILVWGAANLAVQLFSASAFAILLVHLYRAYSGVDRVHLPIDRWQHVDRPLVRFLSWSKRKWAWVLLILVVVGIGIGVMFFNSVRFEDHTQVTAHRGASGDAPENTLAAIELAMEQKADWAEIDVQETRDGVVVVIHDSDFKKIAGKDLKISDANYEDLSDIDIGSHFAAEFSDQRVPTLDQVLKMCKGKIGVNIELKTYGRDQQLEQRVIDVVEANRMENEVVIMSLEKRMVEKMRQLRPDWTIGLLAAVAAGDLADADVSFLAVNGNLATSSFIRSAHKRDKQVYTWTINDPFTISMMISRGVDNIITDYPAVARDVLDQRAQMSTLQRMMLEVAAYFGVRPHSLSQ